MKLKKTKRDIVESIKAYQKTRKNEMFEVEKKVQAVATPSFVDAIVSSQANRKLATDRMKEKDKDTKELIAQTVTRTANKTPQTDAMKKMKLVEAFVVETLKGKVTIKENVMSVLTTSRADITKLIENARTNGVKYSINRIAEGYQFNYKFEILNESKKEDSVKDLKGLTIEEIFFKVIGRKFEVFDKQGHFTKEALKHYDKVASAYGEDEFDRLCAEEECFLNEEKKEINRGHMTKKASKKLGEAKSLTSSPHKDLIGKHFDYSGDFDFLEIVSDVLDRIDFENADEIDAEVQDAVDSALTYIADQWTIAQHYASGPDSLDWDEVVSEFESDIRSIVDEIKGE